MLNSKQIKKIATQLGADLCGIAAVDSFKEAPKGFHPKDIYEDTKSVLVFAKRFPASSLNSKSKVPYAFAGDMVLEEVFKITIQLVNIINDYGLFAIPIPSEPYEYWDENKKEGRGILSLKHAGYLAGLGFLGKNTLLYNERFGNMITLGAVLINQELKSDPIAAYKFCKDQCSLCIQNCPVQAIDGTSVIQKLCRENSQITTAKGYSFYTCSKCRTICPGKNGIKEKVRVLAK